MKAEVYNNNQLVGFLSKEDDKYIFKYENEYLLNPQNSSISLTLPKREEAYISDTLFPFFFGLLSEGTNKEIQCKLLKIDENDDFIRLLKTAKNDTIGAITIMEIE
ncbi:MAG: HipA N-terminal domain-containing protein [Bacteroidetes bacterium]|nr:HipA N-terminal domain-containing protein [Bacteroidota bacterium]MBU1113896.1 HipA N-terminal domain-containing protein [Bacteroidota bacterium]MBU1798078.1 HipA N-terminal domain-containing protein [Bacteroidota bacterium]